MYILPRSFARRWRELFPNGSLLRAASLDFELCGLLVLKPRLQRCNSGSFCIHR